MTQEEYLQRAAQLAPQLPDGQQYYYQQQPGGYDYYSQYLKPPEDFAMLPAESLNEMRRAIETIHRGKPFEVRLMNTAEPIVFTGKDGKEHTTPLVYSGTFDSFQSFAAALRNFKFYSPDKATETEYRQRGTKLHFYISLQVLSNSYLEDVKSGKQWNRFRKSSKNTRQTGSSDIVAYKNLLFDFDPVRQSGTSSTEEQRQDAEDSADALIRHLSDKGFPDPVKALSGNGYHVMYAVNIARDAAADRLVRDLYTSIQGFIAEINTHSTVKIDFDMSFSNKPAQLGKLWGSKAKKGDNTPGTPHRWSKIISAPDTLTELTTEQIKQYLSEFPPIYAAPGNERPQRTKQAAAAKTETGTGTTQTNEIIDFLIENKIDYREKQCNDGTTKYIVKCPWADTHTTPTNQDDAAVFFQGETKCFSCFHAHCSDKHWSDFAKFHNKGTKKDVKPVGRRLTLTRQYVEQYLLMTNRTIGMDILQNRIRFDGFPVKLQRTMLDSCADMIVDNLIDDGQQDRVLCTGIAINCGREATVPAYDEHGKQCGESPVEYTFSGISKNRVCDLILDIAHDNPINPVLDKIQSVEWDGTDRLRQWYDMWHIDDDLSRTLIRKWSMQAICALHNAYNVNGDNYNLDLVLVLDGEQGIGKTTFFRHLAMFDDYFADGVTLNPRDTDSIMQATSKWIVELGEIGSTFKSDLDALKGFLSKSTDEYRSPYARQATICPRHTVFCGSVNGDDYLIDGTGNRRFGTIRIADGVRVDVNTMHKTFDSLQFWAQIYSMVEQDVANGKTYGNCFRLTAEEHEQLAKRNNNHRKLDKGEAELLDIMDVATRYIWRDMTVTDFLMEHDGLRNTRITATQLSKLLKRHGYLQLSKRTTNARLYYLPTCTIAPQQQTAVYPVPLPAGQSYTQNT